jgi:hypothetical protein
MIARNEPGLAAGAASLDWFAAQAETHSTAATAAATGKHLLPEMFTISNAPFLQCAKTSICDDMTTIKVSLSYPQSIIRATQRNILLVVTI